MEEKANIDIPEAALLGSVPQIKVKQNELKSRRSPNSPSAGDVDSTSNPTEFIKPTQTRERLLSDGSLAVASTAVSGYTSSSLRASLYPDSEVTAKYENVSVAEIDWKAVSHHRSGDDFLFQPAPNNPCLKTTSPEPPSCSPTPKKCIYFPPKAPRLRPQTPPLLFQDALEALPPLHAPVDMENDIDLSEPFLNPDTVVRGNQDRTLLHALQVLSASYSTFL